MDSDEAICLDETSEDSNNDNESKENEMATPKKEKRVKLSEEEKKELLLKRKREKLIAEKEQEEKKQAEALRQMTYLIKLSETYSQYFVKNMSKYKVLQERNTVEPPTKNGVGNKKSSASSASSGEASNVMKHLNFFKGTLHPYQVEGVTWLHILYSNGFNGILADEMGLGKTIQVIALISILIKQHIKGPYLIVSPLSVVPNWISEFKKFAPKIPVVSLCGSADTRKENSKFLFKETKVGTFSTPPVVIVSYQTPLIEFNVLKQFCWRYIIVDEGHRIKNHNTQLAQTLRKLKSENRLLLTGTPLQNNITELWSLLNFLLPEIFNDMNTFTNLLLLEDIKDQNKLLEKEQSDHLISKLHKVLSPFMLRRLKKDVISNMVPKKEVTVYCPLSSLQIKLYDYIISRNIAALRGLENESEFEEPERKKRKCTFKVKSYKELSVDNEEDLSMKFLEDVLHTDKEGRKMFADTLKRVTMQNPLMMFRKVVNHPYLVHFPLDPSSSKKQLLINEDLVTSSGKLQVLDKLLPELEKRGHKVLLFSQLVMGLDLIEEYMIMRNHSYTRLDGSLSLEARTECIKEFNENPKILAFLLSTRAGSLGLNLTSADTVIFFDHDWNPQADIQAQDRCHRIGQKKPVVIYHLVAKNTIDEAIIDRGKIKKILEKVVISDGKFKTLTKDDKTKTEDMLLELRQALQTSNEDDFYMFSNNVELDKLLDRSDLYEIMKNQNCPEWKRKH